jgi:hypothetical protein
MVTRVASAYNPGPPRGTGVSVTRWSPKPQRQVRFLGPPLEVFQGASEITSRKAPSKLSCSRR